MRGDTSVRRWTALLRLDLADPLDRLGAPRGVGVPESAELIAVLVGDGHLNLLHRALERRIVYRLTNRLAQRLEDSGRRGLRREEADPQVVLDVVAQLLERGDVREVRMPRGAGHGQRPHLAGLDVRRRDARRR